MFEGNIFSGESDLLQHEFYLTKVKHLNTQSNISKQQLEKLHSYLSHYSEKNESCTLTINDQIPLLLNSNEVHQLIVDLQKIQEII
ncbi:hypothetical protein [Aquibacillus rhizosphaerae]|uniref:Uncharacterized protein n=1 Tax=Aquibacillus rhizosphaerae TaxID=3051431 RepID=A0ABT7L0N0_9BACI|nr:hypothetical protein [Aquibacillus sp. LR5S19]MDL4839338.1 hypothetical protein [Aquibacillus sp. LR5S19]